MVGSRIYALVLPMLALFGWALFAGAGAGAAPPGLTSLDQGWNQVQEQSYYFTPQGTVLMPSSWLEALQGADGKPFMAPERMRRIGFIYDDRPSPANPYKWPIGFALNSAASTGGLPTAGLTCAACHTSELTYHGAVLRVDGGQANIDLDAFKRELSAAILATGSDPARLAAFQARAVELGFPQDKIAAAFGARYEALKASLPERQRYLAASTSAGPGRNDALAAIALQLLNTDIGVPGNTNKATAPVDFPYLWNIANLFWVQYNGSVHQPMSRNIGEAIGVGAITNIVDPATGALNPVPQRWQTSIPVGNLFAIETLLESLKPPRWPTAVFGPVDRAKAAAGRQLFGQNCAACHAVRALAGSKFDEWSVKVLPLSKIGTDPRQAENFAKDTYDASKIGLSKTSTAGAALLLATNEMRDQAYRDAGIPAADWPKFDGNGRKNLLTSPCGYKARPLVGVWSTPPFLHNGSVLSIYSLLSESRPAIVHTGTTQFDPVHLGFADATGPRAFAIDTSLAGNSNAGHWFTSDAKRPGRIGPHLSDAQKYDIIEYLKVATYADYPRVVVQKPDPEPCIEETAAGAYR